MSPSPNIEFEVADFQKENFDIHDLKDEIRVDALCERFLRIFHRHLLDREKRSPDEAGALARGVDYFLREFVIPDRKENIFALPPKRVRQFAGNWYIVKNLEPNLAELGQILKGIQAFYEFCLKLNMITPATTEDIRKECAARDYYQSRIDHFWEIKDDGYWNWERECSLKE